MSRKHGSHNSRAGAQPGESVPRRTGRREVVLFLSTAGFLGLLPWAPGTFGTLAGVGLFALLGRLPLWWYVSVVIAFSVAAIPVAAAAEGLFGSHDDGRVVIDEVAGYLVTMIGAPWSLGAAVLGFLCFRFFDILKPWPCGTIDRRVSGGLGVMLDDLAAGIYGAAVVQTVLFIWPAIGRWTY